MLDHPLTTAEALQIWAACNLTFLGLGFWLGNKWKNWNVRRLQIALEVERSYNQAWRGGR